MNGRYRFALTFRVDTPMGLHVDPERFETSFVKDADRPGSDGWLFFRDTFWRGEVNDPEDFRDRCEEVLDVPVENVEFRAFEVDEEYLAAFREEIANDLDEFKADSVDEVVNKYLGSRLEVGLGGPER
ncbi:LWR-salt protein [Halocalculus aciditolerans]|uniref:LWR-salt protein n=1 Tax=Halocalculus aciditolerans TaxID=1383812 RepID=A0A830F941_9EURY|nr:LWR-salt protein [Halocalculus aciditolerans]GGL51261.1 hypothetical protein GCM10009039_06900 [Halocalculus aciditolerans]